jgi:hypothetical protein
MNPADTFYIRKSRLGYWEVIPFNVGYHNIMNPSAGAAFFWQSNLGLAPGKPFPDEREIIAALSNNDMKKRRAARGYLEMNRSEDSFQRIFASCQSPDEITWTGVGILDVMVRTDGTTHTLSIGKIKEALKKSADSLSPGLETLAAVAIAIDPSDTTDLERVAKRTLAEKDLAEVKYDIVRILRYSTRIRNKVLELEPEWAGLSKAEIEALGRMDIFSLP